MKKQVSRRSFMKHVVAAGIAMPLIAPRLSMASPPTSRLQHAVIGVGGKGRSDLAGIYSHGNVDIVALCDIDTRLLDAASKDFPKARLYRDWREMLDKEEKNIDSVDVATPDHTHAPASMTAINMGKHVFCEKPLTHEVYEARKLTVAAHRRGVATQMGIQIHSHNFYRTAVEWIKGGAIGKVKEWHSWCGASYTTEDKKRPQGSDPVPPEIDWDLWLGVAPHRPYKKDTYHPFQWRRWRDFGGGATGDFGCHIFDPVFTALGVWEPLSVSVQPECVSEEVWPAWIEADYVFNGTGLTAGKTINATWKDGGKKPDKGLSPHLPKDYALPGSGSMLLGEEGTLIIPHVGKPELYPMEKYKDYPLPELEPKNHYHEFVEAALGNTTAGANFGFSGPLTEAVLISNIANRYPGQTLKWDAQKMRFTNHDEANKYLWREYREGWDVRGLWRS